MRILVTNDDGINAIGIKKLADRLNNIGEVTVISPDREMSATGHAITLHHPLRVKKVDYLNGINAWSLNGTPSDCIKIGIEEILKKTPDVVVSGINNGPNLGTDVIYSGTVAAAIEGAIHNIPSIAISIAEIRKKINYDSAAYYSNKIVKMLLKIKRNNTAYNINVPSIFHDEIKGIEITKLGIRKYKNTYIKRIDPMGRNYYWLSGNIIDMKHNVDTDVFAIKQNKISVTPLHYDLTDYKLIENINIQELYDE